MIWPGLLLFLLLALPFGLAGTAAAADYEPPIAVEEAPEVPVEVGSGWYLRGDVAYSFNESPYKAFADDGYDVSSVRFGAGGGVGYHFSDMLRGDVTVNFLSRDKLSFDAPDVSYSYENQAWSGMANAYVDLGTYSGFTPYLGAGVGLLYSRNRAELTADGVAAKDVATETKLAYALMAGVSYRLGTNAAVDLGYQFTASPQTTHPDAQSLAEDRGLNYHQVKLGFRYDLW